MHGNIIPRGPLGTLCLGFSASPTATPIYIILNVTTGFREWASLRVRFQHMNTLRSLISPSK